jgi:membrane-associated phospholipid phosphatase
MARCDKPGTIGEGLWLALLTLDVANRGPITRWEQRHARPPQRFPPAAEALSRVGAPATLRAGILIALVVRAWRGAPVLGPLLRVLGAVVLRREVSWKLARPRPPSSWWQEEPDGWSYPSRHTMYALLLARLAMDGTVPPPAGETVYWLTVVLVGGSRLRLGVHWPTDVLGAALATDVWWRLTASRDVPSRALTQPSRIARQRCSEVCS